MAFFSKAEKKEEPKKEETPRGGETQRQPRTDLKVEKKVLRSFILGLATSDKLAGVANEKIEEGLRAVLPKTTKVTRIDPPESVAGIAKGMRETMRFFEIALSAQEMPLALSALSEKGLLDGQVEISLEQCVLVAKASGKVNAVSIAAEPIDSLGLRYDIKGGSTEVLVQYPPLEVHKRWLADDDYCAAYTRWRTQRSEDTAKSPKWQSLWPQASGEDSPPWIKLKPKDGKTDEFSLEFDEKILLRFAFQGAEITIMRFNLKVLVNKLTNEYAVYRSLPLSLGSVPKEVQDRMNREPERYKPLREPGKFGHNFDLVRSAYESLGDDYFYFQAGEQKNAPAPSSASSASGSPSSSQRIPVATVAAPVSDAPIPLSSSVTVAVATTVTPVTIPADATPPPMPRTDPFASNPDHKAAASAEPTPQDSGRPKHAQGVKSIANLGRAVGKPDSGAKMEKPADLGGKA